MGTVNKPSVTKPNPETVRTAHLSVLMTVHNFQYTIQHIRVLIICSSYLQKIIIAQMLPIGGEGTRTTYEHLERDQRDGARNVNIVLQM